MIQVKDPAKTMLCRKKEHKIWVCENWVWIWVISSLSLWEIYSCLQFPYLSNEFNNTTSLSLGDVWNTWNIEFLRKCSLIFVMIFFSSFTVFSTCWVEGHFSIWEIHFQIPQLSCHLWLLKSVEIVYKSNPISIVKSFLLLYWTKLRVRDLEWSLCMAFSFTSFSSHFWILFLQVWDKWRSIMRW